MKDKKKAFAFLGVVTLFSMACSFAHPVTPSLFKQLELADYMFGVALACMSFGNLLFSPFWGKMSGYLSSRKTMMICCIGYALGQLSFAFSRTVPVILAVRFLTGVFVGGIFVSMLTYVVNTSPDEKSRGRYLVYLATLEGVFNSVGYFVGGMLGEISIVVAVVTQAVTLAACGLLFRFVCSDDAHRESLPGGAAMLRDINPFRSFIQGRRFMTCLMGVLFIVCALQNFSQTCFDQSFNYYVIDQIGLSTGYNGAIKGVMGLVTLAANSTICVWMMKKTDTKKSVIILLFLCGAVMTAAMFVNALAPYLIMNVVFYAMSAISIPILQDIVAADGRRRKYDSNLVMGFYNAMRSFGGIIGALLAGFTYMVTPKTPFICCVIGFLMAACCAMIFARGSRREARKEMQL